MASYWSIPDLISTRPRSTVVILKEPEADNPLKPLIGALGGVTGDPKPEAKHPSTLMDLTNLAKMSGISGFPGLSTLPAKKERDSKSKLVIINFKFKHLANSKLQLGKRK